MEETVSLSKILEIIKKHIKIIIASTVIITMIVAVVSMFVLTPTYEASSQFIVSEPKDKQTNEFDSSTIQTNLEMINTYTVVITSRAILDSVIEVLDLPYSAESLERNIYVSNEPDSQVVTVDVLNQNHETATKIANQIVTTFQEKIPDIMNVDNVNILTTAEELKNPRPIDPNVGLNTTIGLIVGLMLGVGTAFLIEYFDTTIKAKEDVEKKIGVPVIGMISHVERSDLKVENNLAQRSQTKYV